MAAETEQWEKAIGLADMHGTVARVSYSPPDGEDDEPFATVGMSSGSAMISSSATPTALRQLAAAYLDAADALEAKS
jgi:hypothetical protein